MDFGGEEEADQNDDSFEFDLPKMDDPEDKKPKAKIEEPRGTSVRVTQKFSRTTTLRVTEVYTKDSFDIVKKLGSGAYGTVWLVKHKRTGHKYAMKEL